MFDRKAYMKEYRLKNQNKRAKAQKEWRLNNKNYAREYNKKYYKTFKSIGSVREAWNRCRAKKLNVFVCDVTRKEMQNFYAQTPEGYEVDHIIPLNKGGSHSISNLAYLTPAENQAKGDKI